MVHQSKEYVPNVCVCTNNCKRLCEDHRNTQYNNVTCDENCQERCNQQRDEDDDSEMTNACCKGCKQTCEESTGEHNDENKYGCEHNCSVPCTTCFQGCKDACKTQSVVDGGDNAHLCRNDCEKPCENNRNAPEEDDTCSGDREASSTPEKGVCSSTTTCKEPNECQSVGSNTDPCGGKTKQRGDSSSSEDGCEDKDHSSDDGNNNGSPKHNSSDEDSEKQKTKCKKKENCCDDSCKSSCSNRGQKPKESKSCSCPGSAAAACRKTCKNGGNSKNKKNSPCSCPGDCKKENRKGKQNKDGKSCGKDCTQPCKDSKKSKDKQERCSCPKDCRGGKMGKDGTEDKSNRRWKRCQVCTAKKKHFSYEDYLAGATNDNGDPGDSTLLEGIPTLFPTLNDVYGPTFDDTILNVLSAWKGDESEGDSDDNDSDKASGEHGQGKDQGKRKTKNEKSESGTSKDGDTEDNKSKDDKPDTEESGKSEGDSSSKEQKPRGKSSNKKTKSSKGSGKVNKDNDTPNNKNTKASKKGKGSNKNESGDLKQGGDDATGKENGESENAFALRDIFGVTGDEAVIAAISTFLSLFSPNVDGEADESNNQNSGSNKSDKPDDKKRKTKGNKKNKKDDNDDDSNGKNKTRKGNCRCNPDNEKGDETAEKEDKDSESQKEDNDTSSDNGKKKSEEESRFRDNDSEDDEPAEEQVNDSENLGKSRSEIQSDASIEVGDLEEISIKDLEESVDEPADPSHETVTTPNGDLQLLEQDDLGVYDPGAGEHPIHIVQWLHEQYMSLANDMESLSADLDAKGMITRLESIKEREDALDDFSAFLDEHEMFKQMVRDGRRSTANWNDLDVPDQSLIAVPRHDLVLPRRKGAGNSTVSSSSNETQTDDDDLWSRLQFQDAHLTSTQYGVVASQGNRAATIESDPGRQVIRDDDSYTWTSVADASGSRRRFYEEDNKHGSFSNILLSSHLKDESTTSPKESTQMYSDNSRQPVETRDKAPGTRQMRSHHDLDSFLGNDFRQPGITSEESPESMPQRGSGSRLGDTFHLPGIITGGEAHGSMTFRDSSRFVRYDFKLLAKNSGEERYSSQRSYEKQSGSNPQEGFGLLRTRSGSARLSRHSSEQDYTDELLLYLTEDWHTPKRTSSINQRGTSGWLSSEETDRKGGGLEEKSSPIGRKVKSSLLRKKKKAIWRRNMSLNSIAEESADEVCLDDVTRMSSYRDVLTSRPCQEKTSPKTKTQLAICPQTLSSNDPSNGVSTTKSCYTIELDSNFGYEKKISKNSCKYESISDKRYEKQCKEAIIFDQDIGTCGLNGVGNSAYENKFQNDILKCHVDTNDTQPHTFLNKKHKRPPMHILNHRSDTEYPEFAFGILDLDKSSPNVETLWKTSISSQDYKSSTIFNDPDFTSHPSETVSVNGAANDLDDTNSQWSNRLSRKSDPYDENVDTIEIIFPPTERYQGPLESIAEGESEPGLNSSSMFSCKSSCTGKSSVPFFRSMQTQTSADDITAAEKNGKCISKSSVEREHSLKDIFKDPLKMSICTQFPSIRLFSRERQSKSGSAKARRSGSQDCMVSKCVGISDEEDNTRSRPTTKNNEIKCSCTRETKKQRQENSSPKGKAANQELKRCSCTCVTSCINKSQKFSQTKKRKRSTQVSFLESHPRWKRCLSQMCDTVTAQGERILKNIKSKQCKHLCIEPPANEVDANNEQIDSEDESSEEVYAQIDSEDESSEESSEEVYAQHGNNNADEGSVVKGSPQRTGRKICCDSANCPIHRSNNAEEDSVVMGSPQRTGRRICCDSANCPKRGSNNADEDSVVMGSPQRTGRKICCDSANCPIHRSNNADEDSVTMGSPQRTGRRICCDSANCPKRGSNNADEGYVVKGSPQGTGRRICCDSANCPIRRSKGQSTGNWDTKSKEKDESFSNGQDANQERKVCSCVKSYISKSKKCSQTKKRSTCESFLETHPRWKMCVSQMSDTATAQGERILSNIKDKQREPPPYDEIDTDSEQNDSTDESSEEAIAKHGNNNADEQSAVKCSPQRTGRRICCDSANCPKRGSNNADERSVVKGSPQGTGRRICCDSANCPIRISKEQSTGSWETKSKEKDESFSNGQDANQERKVCSCVKSYISKSKKCSQTKKRNTCESFLETHPRWKMCVSQMSDTATAQGERILNNIKDKQREPPPYDEIDTNSEQNDSTDESSGDAEAKREINNADEDLVETSSSQGTRREICCDSAICPKRGSKGQSTGNWENKKTPQDESSPNGKDANQEGKKCSCVKSSINKSEKSFQSKKRERSVYVPFLESHPRWKKCLSQVSVTATAKGERILSNIKDKQRQPPSADEVETDSEQNDSEDESSEDAEAKHVNNNANEDSVMTDQEDYPNVEVKVSPRGTGHGICCDLAECSKGGKKEQSTGNWETEKKEKGKSSSKGKDANQEREGYLCPYVASGIKNPQKLSQTTKRKRKTKVSCLDTHPRCKQCKRSWLEPPADEADANNEQNDSKDESSEDDCAKDGNNHGDTVMTQQGDGSNMEVKGSKKGADKKDKLPSTSNVEISKDGSGKAVIEWGPSVAGQNKGGGKDKDDSGKSRKPKKSKNSQPSEDESQNVAVTWGLVQIHEFNDGSNIFTFSNTINNKPKLVKQDIFVVFVVAPGGKKKKSKKRDNEKNQKCWLLRMFD